MTENKELEGLGHGRSIGVLLGSLWDRGEVRRMHPRGGLERFYPNFLRQGITESKFVDLIVSDYQGLGISDLKVPFKL
eukprot:1367194-Amorphochlora_amoeboformis.AAC.2